MPNPGDASHPIQKFAVTHQPVEPSVSGSGVGQLGENGLRPYFTMLVHRQFFIEARKAGDQITAEVRVEEMIDHNMPEWPRVRKLFPQHVRTLRDIGIQCGKHQTSLVLAHSGQFMLSSLSPHIRGKELLYCCFQSTIKQSPRDLRTI